MTQPPPTPGRGDVWLDILRDLTGRVPWRRWMWWRPRDRRSDDAVLVVAKFAADPRTWVRSPWPHITAYFAILRPVIADIATRRDLGIRRYGAPLQYDNGRDPTRDAYEEALDLLAYLTQGHMPRWMRWLALLLIVALRRRLT